MSSAEELTPKKFMKNLAGFSAASWISAAVSFFATPVFTRLYLPEEAGRINVFMTFAVFFQTIGLLGLDQAFMRYYNESLDGITKNNMLAVCLKINYITAGISAAAVLIFHSFFSVQVSGYSNLIVPVCLSSVIFSGVTLRMTSISSRMQNSVLLYTIQMTAAVLTEKVLYLLIAFFRADHLHAVIAVSAGYLASAVIFLLVSKKRKLLETAKKIPFGSIASLLKLSVPYVPVLMLSWLNNSIPLYSLKRYTDYASVGIYTSAVTISNILTIIQTGFGAYWDPLVYRYYNDETKKKMLESIQRYAVFAVFALGLSVIGFQDIIYLLVGERFRAGKQFFALLIFMPLCSMVSQTTGIGIMISKKSYLNNYSFLFSAAANLILSEILIPRIGIAGAACAAACASVVMMCIRTHLGRRYYRISSSISFIVWSFLIFSAAAAAGFFLAGESTVLGALCLSALILLCALFRTDLKKAFDFIRSQHKKA